MSAFNYRQRWYRRSQLLNREIPSQVAHWLFDASSLTARLVQRCGPAFNVRLLSQAYTRIN
ncbi:MAG TPA: chorismate lyase, partial [Thiotrichales bacterium]|nr:chorismate lyase [Thiotrichales bacterium]